MKTRLFRTIVVFGAGVGATAGVITLIPSCDLYVDDGHHRRDAYFAIIDVPRDAMPDGWSHIADAWPIIDASLPIDGGSGEHHDGGER